jgi:Holliday junction resolvasome RuvABC endonuclease subunit
VTGPILGIDPGVNLGLVVADISSGGRTHSYEVLEHITITTDTRATVADRLAAYGSAVESYATRYKPVRAVVEVRYRYSGRTGKMSAYTREGRNNAGLCLLDLITGSIVYALFRAGVPVKLVSSPTGKTAKDYAKMRQAEAKMLTGLKLNEHEAVALALALSGLWR